MTVSRNTLMFALLVAFSYGLFVLVYDVLIEHSRYTLAIRLPTLLVTVQMWDILLGLCYVLLPFAWLRFSGRFPSKVLYIYFLFSILLPAVLFLVTNETMGWAERHGRAVFCVFCFLVIYIPYWAPKLRLPELRRQSDAGWKILFVGLILSCVYLIALDPSALAGLSVLDVYGQRLEIRDGLENGDFSRINVYLTNWMGLAIAPFLVSYGIFYTRWRFVFLALVVAFIAFSISSHKSVLFATPISGLFAVALRYRTALALPRNLIINVGFSILVAFLVMPFVLDLILGRGTLATWLTAFRLFLNNGYLTSVYLEFFSDQELLYYSESFLRAFIPSENELSYSRRVGDYVMQYKANNNANANFLADGYANLGYVGMIFASLQLAAVFWVIDGLARGRHIGLVACIVLPAGLAFSNVPIHTGLVSNGVLLCLLLITLLPRQKKCGTIQKDQHRD